mmetsp:Transcript_120745/g.301267  ORF Transcript_120745/g.301267 Transcript_120745/m.301267 type:complete len:201 (+) Transcript_120745:111-713(+)
MAWRTATSVSLIAFLIARSCPLTSFTLAGLLPLMFKMVSTRSSNFNPASWLSSKICGNMSARVRTSAPACSMTRAQSGSVMIFSTSSRGRGTSMLTPMCVRAERRSVARANTVIPSFSVFAIALTTSTSTPTSMFISVTEARATKETIRGQKTRCSAVTEFTKVACSGRMPMSKRVFIETPMLPKYSESSLSPIMRNASA